MQDHPALLPTGDRDRLHGGTADAQLVASIDRNGQPDDAVVVAGVDGFVQVDRSDLLLLSGGCEVIGRGK